MRTTLAVLGFLMFGFNAAAAEPFDGNWKLNLEKSKLQTNDIVSRTNRIVQTGPITHHSTTDIVLKSGKTFHREFDRTYDGKEHPVFGGFTEGLSEVCVSVDESTRKITQKKDGKVLGDFTVVLSKDGKVMTSSFSNGEIQVYDRQ